MVRQVQGGLPPGAVLGLQLPTMNPAYDPLCQMPSPLSSVNRSLSWMAPPNFGGNISVICFTATDSCGGCGCAGGVNVTVQCVSFLVLKCRYSVGYEHQVNFAVKKNQFQAKLVFTKKLSLMSWMLEYLVSETCFQIL